MEEHIQCALNQFEKTYKKILNPESTNYNPDLEGFYSSVLKLFAKSYSGASFESAIWLKSRFTCLRLVLDDLISNYFYIRLNQISSNGGSSIVAKAYCQ